jgi:hypothetical protein
MWLTAGHPRFDKQVKQLGAHDLDTLCILGCNSEVFRLQARQPASFGFWLFVLNVGEFKIKQFDI